MTFMIYLLFLPSCHSTFIPGFPPGSRHSYFFFFQPFLMFNFVPSAPSSISFTVSQVTLTLPAFILPVL